MEHSGAPAFTSAAKPTILHLGEPIIHHLELHRRLQSQFEFINPPASDLERSAFIAHLKNRTWGNFSAIMRPFWNTGGEMGRWDKEIIELLPKTVKVYASAGAGYDWVDTHALADQGILYCNARGASTEAVADMALYYVISVFRNMAMSHLSARSLNSTKFNDAHFNLPLTSHNPRGHTLGIIGLGDIGFAIAKKVYAALGMRILYNDTDRKSTSNEEEVKATFYSNLEDMLGLSDCLVVATPFSGKTLITADLLAKCKPGSRLVNIARGSLIDESALADALDSGHLSGAGLDVHANEPYVNPRLANNWKVGITSHTGGGALETWIQFEKLAMENVERVLTGREALTGVNGHLFSSRNNDPSHVNGDVTNGGSNGTLCGEIGSMADVDKAEDVDGHEHSCKGEGEEEAIHHQIRANGDDNLIPTSKEYDGNMQRQIGILGGV